MIKAKAYIQHIFTSGQLRIEESKQLVDSFNDKLLLDSCLKKRFRGKRYLVIITVKDFEEIEPFKFDNSAFLNTDDWLPVGDLKVIKTRVYKQLPVIHDVLFLPLKNPA